MFPIRDNIPTGRFPVITAVIIAINVAVFLFFQQPSGFGSVDNEKVVKYGAIPYELTHPGKECGDGTQVSSDGTLVGEGGQTIACEGETVDTEAGPVKITGVSGSQPSSWLTIFTAMFMHGGFLHIAGNMLFLWIFGNNVEDSMGRLRFAFFYLLGGIAALGLQTAIDPSSTVPTIGASGAIAAVLGGYLLLYPRARVVTARVPLRVLHHHRAAGDRVPGHLDRPADPLRRRRPDQPDGRRRRRGLLRAHRRIRVRAAGDQSVRDQAQGARAALPAVLMRDAVLGIALVFIGLLAALTIDVIARDGVTPDVVIALGVLALLGVGIVGALRNPPRD